MTYNESRYASMKKYRDSTREKYNLYQKNIMVKYQNENRDIINEKLKYRNRYIRECRIFRNILLNF